MFGTHKRALERAQDLWDAGLGPQAVQTLEPLLPRLHPQASATDALILATLATYVCELGEPARGLMLLSRVPLDGVRLAEVHRIVLSARVYCRAVSGDVDGAKEDRARIAASDPRSSALLMADTALARYGPE